MTNILFTALGATKLSEATYGSSDRTYRTKFCCLAVTQLLQKTFDTIYVFLTAEAKEMHLENLIEESNRLNLTIKVIDIVSGQNIEEIWQIFDVMTQSMDPETSPNIFLDITNSYRHLPLLSFTSLSYLESSQKANLAGIYYGAFDPNRPVDELTPIFDLTPLANIVRGSYGVRAFEETGSVSQLGHFFDDLLALDAKDRKDFGNHLDSLHRAVNSGLSIESGDAARELCNWLNARLKNKTGLKAADTLVARLKSKVALIKTDENSKKAKRLLTIEELKRQLEFIRWQIVSQSSDTALLLLREWVINRVWLAEKPPGNWLKVKDRETLIERPLGYWGLLSRKPDKMLENQPFFALVKKWDQISQRRNEFAHAGFRIDPVKPENSFEFASDLMSLCEEKIKDDDFWRLPQRVSNGRKILVSGMGASFGLLYSAVKLVQPDVLVVVSSEKFRSNINEACERAGFDDKAGLHVFAMQDVFCGFGEARNLVTSIWPVLNGAESVVINLTGGTTAMQWVMQSVYEMVARSYMPVERVAFVDPRPTAEQQSHPWHLGKMVEIEKMLLEKEI